MNAFESVMDQRLIWSPASGTERDFFSDVYPGETCFLRINDFPDEPLWTLFLNGESFNFDETPPKWTVIFGRKK